ncbi:MAG TPA: heavy metal translocating P-type ATPase [Gemmatimonadaceae bacterium]|nr:heavy metal translocating P-type ATPase [Gemmatimonadaceae bacterium]
MPIRGAALRAAWRPLFATAVIAAGLVARAAAPAAGYDRAIWYVGLVIAGGLVVWHTVQGALRGQFAADVVATLAIVASVLLGQPFVGLVIVIMQTGGEALEQYAEGRASDAVRALEALAPRIAHRLRDERVIEDVPVDAVVPDDVLLVRPGELVPCDAIVVDGTAHVDVSMLTGEPLPVYASRDTKLMSGSANLDGALTIRVLAPARDSQYARIVALVRSAQASKAPLQRVADRYAIWFTPVTLAVCVVAYATSGDWLRVLAVLAVATPCPLILATPVAVIGGINRAARRHIIVRHGTALERLGTATVAVFDKTGTITIGQPRVSRVIQTNGRPPTTVLRLAGAVERSSGHLLARTLVDAAEAAGLTLPAASGVVESPGRGVSGTVDGHRVVVGARSFVLDETSMDEARFSAVEPNGAGLRAYVAIDGEVAGIVEYADALRPGVADVLRDLTGTGIRRIMLLSGDHAANARSVAASVGLIDVQGDLLPEDKVRVVRQLVRSGESVLMVGDGTNDAPALSAATVGVALAGHGGGITAEAADVVILIDDLSRVVEAVRISRRTMHIARQCIGVGLGLSGVAMVAAAMGAVAPTAGALLQEAIDLAVILNALRASR